MCPMISHIKSLQDPLFHVFDLTVGSKHLHLDKRKNVLENFALVSGNWKS